MWQCLLLRISQAQPINPTESNQFVESSLQNRFQRAWQRATAHQESQWAHTWESCQRMHLTPELNPAAVMLLSPGQTAGQYLCGRQQIMGLQENNYPPFPCLVCSSVCFELVTLCLAPSCTQKNQALISCLWLQEEHHNHGNHIPDHGHAATSVVRNTTGKQISVFGAFLCACWFTPAGLALHQHVKKVNQKCSDPCQETKQLCYNIQAQGT